MTENARQAIEQNLLLFKETNNIMFYTICQSLAATYSLTDYLTDTAYFFNLDSKIAAFNKLNDFN